MLCYVLWNGMRMPVVLALFPCCLSSVDSSQPKREFIFASEPSIKRETVSSTLISEFEKESVSKNESEKTSPILMIILRIYSNFSVG